MESPGLRFARPLTLGALAEQYGGEVDREAGPLLAHAIAPLESAGHSALAPFTARRHLQLALRSPALLLVHAELAPLVVSQRRWVHPHAAWVFTQLLESMAPDRSPDRRSHAFIDPTAVIASGVRIGAGAVILGKVRIGEDTIIEPHAVIYPGVRVGARCLIGAGAVIGRPGFGWVPTPSGGIQRVPQLGGVLIEDDVDIGPLATVDAGTLDPTFVARGVRLDAHVHIGHNVRLGERTMVAAQSGFAGSVHVGADVRVGGQAGFADHVVVGDRAQIAAKSGVIGDIPKGGTVAGYPAVERTRWFRGVARMLRLVGK